MYQRTLLPKMICAALLLAACNMESPNTPPSPPPAPTQAAPSEDFGYPNSRILAKPGENTALVEVRSLPNLRPNESQLRTAAREYCGGDAIVGLPVSVNRMRFGSIWQYLIQCR